MRYKLGWISGVSKRWKLLPGNNIRFQYLIIDNELIMQNKLIFIRLGSTTLNYKLYSL